MPNRFREPDKSLRCLGEHQEKPGHTHHCCMRAGHDGRHACICALAF